MKMRERVSRYICATYGARLFWFFSIDAKCVCVHCFSDHWNVDTYAATMSGVVYMALYANFQTQYDSLLIYF